MLFRSDLHDTINRAAIHGFDAVEITAAKHLGVESSQQYRREVKSWIRDAGLECSGLHYIFDGSVKLATADRELNAKCADYLRKVIDVAADMDAKTVIIGSGGTTRSFDPGADRAEATRTQISASRSKISSLILFILSTTICLWNILMTGL